MRILNIAFYRFSELNQLRDLQVKLQGECHRLCLKGTILLSPEGMNGFLAGAESDIRAFQAQIQTIPGFEELEYKESYSEWVPFQRMLVKVKKEIIPLGDSGVKPSLETAPRVSASELKKWLDEGREFVLLDTRNDYEIQFGTFDKAIDLGLKTFRQFRKKLQNLSEIDKSRPTVMFCTGGIRCEKAALVAMKEGFKEVYQLDGGILKYFEEFGSKHYKGECFVFDERVTLKGDLSVGSFQGLFKEKNHGSS